MSTDPITYEYKVKVAGVPWERITAFITEEFAPTDPNAPAALAQDIANIWGREVRWNAQGSKPGHYTQPQKETA